MNAEIIGIVWLLKCYREKNRRSLLCWVFSARIKLRVCSFCFNLDPFPSPLVRISPINTTTSLKQLFCCLWQKGEQTTKSDALWSDNNLTFCAPAERIKWWKKKRRVKSTHALKHEAWGKVTVGQWCTDTHRAICASASRHSRKCSGPYGMVDIATFQGRSLRAFFFYICSQIESCSLHAWPVQLSPLYYCLPLEKIQFWLNFNT